ncbi:hypothetical protein H6771_00175 [Candidatus Peribacteria bacterium]|nr:hypothetical protein [Candidatus Peribacteria bacterium]
MHRLLWSSLPLLFLGYSWATVTPGPAPSGGAITLSSLPVAGSDPIVSLQVSFNPAEPGTSMTCMGQTGSTVTFPLALWQGGMTLLNSPNSTADRCFTAAGTYTIEGLSSSGSTSGSKTVTVMPGSPGAVSQSQSCTVYADGADSCLWSLPLRDPYGNTLTQLEGTTMTTSITADALTPEANLATSFADGLRNASTGTALLTTPQTLTMTGGTIGQAIAAIAPSIVHPVQSGQTIITLSQVVENGLSYTVWVPRITPDGTPHSTAITPLQRRVLLTALPLASLTPSLELLQIGEENTLTLTPDYALQMSATPGITLDVLQLRTSMDQLTQLSYSAEALPYSILGPIDTSDLTPYEVPTTPTEVAPYVYSGEPLDFYTLAQYTVGGKTVRYYSGGMDVSGVAEETCEEIWGYNCDVASMAQYGFAVEAGHLIASPTTSEIDTAPGTSTDRIARTTGLETLHRADAIRSLPLLYTGLDGTEAMSAFWNGQNALLYENEDVTLLGTTGVGTTRGIRYISQLPAGHQVLLIRNGNLLIADDLLPSTTTSTLHIYLLNDTQAPFPATGNVFIEDDVRRLHAHIYADGALLRVPENTTMPLSDWSSVITGAEDATAQLLVVGSLSTQNTVGGSTVKDQTTTQPQLHTPWGSLLDSPEMLTGTVWDGQEAEAVSAAYDLSRLRRYRPGGSECTYATEVLPNGSYGYPGGCITSQNSTILWPTLVTSRP